MALPASLTNGQVSTVNGVSYIYDSATNSLTRTSSGTLSLNSANISTSTTTGALTVAGGAGIAGNVFAGNVLATGFFYANGTPFVSSGYGNTDVASYLPTYSGSIGAASEIVTLTANASAQSDSLAGANAAIVTANTALKAYTDTQITTTQSWVTGANAAIVTANTAVVSYVNTLNTAMASNVAGANAAITTANTAMKGYVDAVTSAWTANAGAQADQIAGANAAIVTANTALKAYTDTQITTTQSWVTGANAAIVTANTALKGYTDNQISTANTALKGYTDNQISTANTALKAYVDTQDSAITSAWTANAGAQANQIAGANAAIVTANTAVVSYVNTQITTTQSWVTGANAAIVTANTALKAYTDAQITNLTNGAPAILDTLGEIATSLGNNASLSTTLLNSIAGSNAAIVTANTALKNYTDGQITVTQSWVTGANAAIVTANTDMKSYVDTQDSAITTAWTSNAGAQANQITGANAAIVTANTALKSYVDTQDSAITSAWTSNAGAQADQITGANIVVATLQANVGSFYTYANATFGASGYSNVQMLANLAAGSNPITFGSNITVTNRVTAANVYSTGVYIGSGSATSGLFWSANSAAVSTGGSGGITYTAGTSPPGSPTIGDQWYNTSTDVLYEYINDGTSSYWVDIVSTVVSSTIANTASWIVTTNTTTSTSTTTGALQVAGGAGIAGNVFAGNVLATGFFYANGTPFVSSSYSNTDVASYLPTYSGSLAASSDIIALYANAGAQSNSLAGANAAIITANTALKGYVDQQFTNLTNGAPAILDTLNEIATSLGNNASLSTTLLNSIAGSNAAIITANTALKSYVDAQDTTTQSWVTGANAAIVTANTAMKSYVDTQDSAITTAWTSNAGAQADQITGANAAIITANTALKSYVDTQDSAITTAWTANAGAQADQITGANIVVATLQANVGGFYTYANATFGASYGNVQMLANLAAGSNPVVFGSNIVAASGTTSTSTTTGALVVAGGAGIAGNVYADNVYSSGNVVATTYFVGNGSQLTGISSAISWTITSSNITVSKNNGYFVDTTTGPKTLTLPASAAIGDTVRINDLAGTFASNNLTVGANGGKIQGANDDLLINVNQQSFGLVYSNSTYGWKVIEL